MTTAVESNELTLPLLVESRGPWGSQNSSTATGLSVGDMEPLASSTARSLALPRPMSERTPMRPRVTRITPEVRGGKYDSEQVRFDADDDMVASRFNTERAAEFEVEHNWVLKEAEERQFKKFDLTKRKLAICLPDDDPLDAIQQRLEEIQSMVKPKAEFANFLEEIPPEQKARILRITNTDVSTIKAERRQKWKAVDRLRWAVFMVRMVLRATSDTKRYFNEEDPSAGPIAMKRFRKKQMESKNLSKVPMHKSSLSFEMQQCLTTAPEYRTNHHIRRIQWVLRATKAFKNFFPTEMEREVARVVSFERYDDNRHIAYQGRPPERFYFVCSGRVKQVREYRLTSGCVNKSMGFMNKGSCSDLEELENNWHREFHLVASGPVEVLQIEREDFVRLQHTTQGPPVDFLWSIDLFKEFPCDEFLHNPEAIEFKYYGQNRVVAKDARRTPWLHVVKSGFVKVVRAQSVVDTRNDDKFNARNTDELGCGRAFSHATVMMGLLAKQRKMKTLMGSEFSLPDLTRPGRGGRNDTKGELTVQTERLPRRSRSISHHSNPPSIVVLEEPGTEDESVMAESEPADLREPDKKSRSLLLPPILPLGGERLIRDASNPQQHGTFLTREKTEFDPVYARKKKKEAQHRRAYIQLDLLKPGDVFGLENMDPPPIPVYEGPAISLVSDGAEIIKISKRFFLQYAPNNTMLRVETMQRQYLSTDEAKNILYDQETWDQYKTSLMHRLIQSLTPR